MLLSTRLLPSLATVLCLASTPVTADASRDSSRPAARIQPEDQVLQAAVFRNELRLDSTKHFAIYHNESDLWVEALGALLEDTYAQFAVRMAELGLRPENEDQPLVWVCFSDRDAYRNYARSADGLASTGLDAYYSSVTNRVAFLRNSTGSREPLPDAPFDGIDPIPVSPQTFATVESVDAVAKVTHEAVHQLSFSRGILNPKAIYPLWITEGMAVHLEYGYSDDTERHELWRQALANARDAGQLLDLRDFVSLTRVDYRDLEPVRLRYAQAWGFYDFISKRYPRRLRAYLVEMTGTSTRGTSQTREIFEGVFGPVESLKSQWENYLNRLQP